MTLSRPESPNAAKRFPADTATATAQPLGKSGYKVTLAQVAVKRALLAAVGNHYWKS